MPRVVFTHAVTDRAHWASKHSERVAAFAPWGTNVVDHFNTENSNNRVMLAVSSGKPEITRE